MTLKNINADLSALDVSPMNARKIHKTKDIDRMAAAIRADGLLNPLTVYKDGARYLVAAGARRLAAIRQLADAGHWTGKVPCRLMTGTIDAASIQAVSLQENVARLDQHPLERWKVFAKLARTMTPEDIAARFGLPIATVRNTLALDRLAFKLRALFAAGEMSAACAFAYCSTVDQNVQLAVFDILPSYRRNRADYIRAAIRNMTETGGRSLRVSDNFVQWLGGADAITAAGGVLTGDLLTGEDDRRVDQAFARCLATERLNQAADEFQKAMTPEGGLAPMVHIDLHGFDYDQTEWAYAQDYDHRPGFAEAVPQHWCIVPDYHAVPETGQDPFRRFGPYVKRADLNAFLFSDDDDQPTEDQPTEDQPTEGDTVKALSQPRLEMLADAATEALAGAIRTDFALAFDMALAALLQSSCNSYGRSELSMVRGAGWDAHRGHVSKDLEDRLSAHEGEWLPFVETLDDTDKRTLFAALVASSIRPHGSDYTGKLLPSPLSCAVHVAERSKLDVREAWDSEARRCFLEKATKAELIDGPILTARPSADREALMAQAKADLVEAAVEASMTTGWLPTYLDDLHHADAPLQITHVAAE